MFHVRYFAKDFPYETPIREGLGLLPLRGQDDLTLRQARGNKNKRLDWDQFGV